MTSILKQTNTQRKYPYSVIVAFKNDRNKCETLMKILYEYSQGRHILDISPLDIYNLKCGITARKEALSSICGYENSEILGLYEMSDKNIFIIADTTYDFLYKGLDKKLKELDLNCHISTEKIINAGNVIKNHDGTRTYGGSTIRDYISHMCDKEQNKNNYNADTYGECLKTVNRIIHKLPESFNYIKSFPFSLFRYSNYIKVNESNEIIIPDIEAKHNLKKLIGTDYTKYNFKLLSMKDATYLESILINKIKTIVAAYAEKETEELLNQIPESKLKHDAVLSTNIDYIINISNKGLIHDIIDYMTNNLQEIINLENNYNTILNENSRKAIFQIEYAAFQNTKDTDDMLWIADLSDALKGSFANYGIIKKIIELGFVPRINGLAITEYDINYSDFSAFCEIAETVKDKKLCLEENLTALIGKSFFEDTSEAALLAMQGVSEQEMEK